MTAGFIVQLIGLVLAAAAIALAMRKKPNAQRREKTFTPGDSIAVYLAAHSSADDHDHGANGGDRAD